MAIMPLYPDKTHGVLFAKRDQPLPEIGVFHLVPFSATEIFSLPALHPTEQKGIHKILGIRIQIHLTAFLEGRKPLDRRHKLHAIVRCHRVAAGELPLIFSVHQNGAPAATAGIAAASAVCIKLYLFQIFSSFFQETKAARRAGLCRCFFMRKGLPDPRSPFLKHIFRSCLQRRYQPAYLISPRLVYFT